MNQGDETGILLEFLYSRLRGNSFGMPVVAMPTDPKGVTGRVFGFSVVPIPSTPEQGGEILFATFHVNVVAIGREGVDDLEPLRGPAKEAAANLLSNSAQPGTRFGTGCILSCVQGMPICAPNRDRTGTIRWYNGHQWVVKVQPDALAH